MSTRVGGERLRAAHLGPERRRPLVLDAALGIFAREGYSGASMQAIANAAGVTKPVLYECFDDKAELFKALLEREQRRLDELMTVSLPDDSAAEDAEALLAHGFTMFLRAVAMAPDSWRLVMLSPHGSDPRVARRIERGRREQTERVRRLTEPVLERARVVDPRGRAEVMAYMIVGAGESAARLMLSTRDWTPERLGPLLAGVIVRGGAALNDERVR
jgi:AcrR family transcriptional regulator